MKRGTISHPKVEDLAFRLGVKLVEAVGHIEALIHFTAEYAPQGDIAKWSPAAVARRCLWEGDPSDFMAALIGAGWVDQVGDRLIVHDWIEHVDDAVHCHLARKRLHFWDGSPPKLGKLNDRERESARAFYAEKPQQNQGSQPGRSQVADKSQPGRGVQTDSSPLPSSPLQRENPPTPLSSERPAGAGGDSLPVTSPPEPEPDHPAWSPPPLVFTRGKERDPRADDAWANRVQALWRERKGGRLPRDQVIGLLAEHIDELGADEVVARLDRYCEAVSGQFATIRNFANGIGDWSEDRRKRLDDDGSLTLEEALRRSREESRQRRAKRDAEQKASAA